MKVTRIYAGKDGKSHFEDIDVPLKDSDLMPHRGVSSTMKATGMFFSLTRGDWFMDFHKGPRKQYILILEGQVDVGIGDGTVRRFKAGDVISIEDTTGQGHSTRSVNGQPLKEVFVPLE
jgi:hypothetical protein